MNKVFETFNTLEKNALKWKPYFDVYERHFSKFVDKSPKILEIGILEGGSIELWLKYFGKGTQIVAVDINPACQSYRYDGDVHIEIGDQSSAEFWQNLLSKYSNFDIIIDDASHIMQHQILTLNMTFPHLKENGIYLCEDTHTSYWQGWGGGYKKNDTFLEYSKNITDVLNKEHINKHDVIPKEFCDTFQNLYSMSFYNSIVILEKRKEELFIAAK